MERVRSDCMESVRSDSVCCLYGLTLYGVCTVPVKYRSEFSFRAALAQADGPAGGGGGGG